MAGPATNGKVHFDSRPSELVRVATAGSVDDGKSTLIGRLLYDAKSLHADTIEAVESASRSRGDGTLDLALLTDGLRAEREQDELDVARGALICRAGEEPAGAREIDATPVSYTHLTLPTTPYV